MISQEPSSQAASKTWKPRKRHRLPTKDAEPSGPVGLGVSKIKSCKSELHAISSDACAADPEMVPDMGLCTSGTVPCTSEPALWSLPFRSLEKLWLGRDTTFPLPLLLSRNQLKCCSGFGQKPFRQAKPGSESLYEVSEALGRHVHIVQSQRNEDQGR